MKIGNIPLNTDIEIVFEYMSKEYCMKIQIQINNTENIFIPAILNNGKPIKPHELKNVKIIYKEPNGVYTFTDIELKAVLYSGANLYEIRNDYEVARVNHRDAFRVFVGDPINFKIIRGDNITTTSGILKDISLTGMGIISNFKIEGAALIELIFVTDEGKKIKLRGNIIRVNELEHNRGFLYGCKFIDKNDSSLGKCLLKRQIEHKKKQDMKKE